MKSQTLILTLLQAWISFLLFPIMTSAPIDSITYKTFLEDIKRNKCAFPNNVVLPFTSPAIFDYLKIPLKVCESPETLKRSREAITLCREIFDTLKNITCSPHSNLQLPEIRVEFSKDVCDGISSLQFSVENRSLLKHLTDKLVCDMLCEDEFQNACKVLLWSYQVQENLLSLPNMQNGENTFTETSISSMNLEKTIVEGKKGSENNDEAQKSSENSKVNEHPAEEKNIGKIMANVQKPFNKHPVEETVISRTKELKSKSTNDAESNIIKSEKNENISNENNEGNSKILNHPNPLKLEESSDKENQPQVDLKKETEAINLKKNSKVNKENDFNNGDPNGNNLNSVPSEQKEMNQNYKQINNETEFKKELSETLISENQEPAEISNKAEAVKNIDTKNLNNGVLNPQHIENKLLETLQNVTSNENQATETEQKSVLPKKETTPENFSKTSVIETDERKSVTKPGKKDDIISDDKVPSTVKNNEPLVTTVANLEEMEGGNEIPENSNKAQESYNDMENEGEYSKLDYELFIKEDDDGFDDPSKNKKSPELVAEKLPEPIIDTQNELPNYDKFPARNSIGLRPEDIQVIPSFPEQEDSHFFFYFLSIILILMAGYLIVHNKKKIIALIVEGRHERRRRSHGVGYKKLETK